MRVFDHLGEWRTRRKSFAANDNVGFVPTMGALHQGHLDLIRRSRSSNEITVVSIFVNPTQFNNSEDFTKYPRHLEKDRQLLESVEVDYLLLPNYDQLYGDQYNYRISEQKLSSQLCGVSRPGHFDGVLTVVLKLLNLVQPHRAYFGEKDYQQLSLIRGMTEAFFVPTEIIGVPTVREASGLAMSSRNQRLSRNGMILAAKLYQTLQQSVTADEAAATLANLGMQIDYVKDIDQRRFAAVFIEGVRLIDNISLKDLKLPQVAETTHDVATASGLPTLPVAEPTL